MPWTCGEWWYGRIPPPSTQSHPSTLLSATEVLPYNLPHAPHPPTRAFEPCSPPVCAVLSRARTFAALGIKYNDAVMTLDLCDRDKKYSNGFCHWPQV